MLSGSRVPCGRIGVGEDFRLHREGHRTGHHLHHQVRGRKDEHIHGQAAQATHEVTPSRRHLPIERGTGLRECAADKFRRKTGHIPPGDLNLANLCRDCPEANSNALLLVRCMQTELGGPRGNLHLLESLKRCCFRVHYCVSRSLPPRALR